MTFKEYLELSDEEERMALFMKIIDELEDDETRKLYQSLPKTNKELGLIE